MALVLSLLSLCTDIYIYLDLRKNFPSRRWYRSIYMISAILCWAALIVAFAWPRRAVTQSIQPVMWTIYAFLTIYVPKILFVVISLIGCLPYLWKSKSWKLGKYVGIPVALIVFFSMWWGAIVTRNVVNVIHVDVISRRLPKSFEGFKIVQISDLHVGTWGEDTRFISRLVDSVNAQKPDVIFFTGDVVNRETNELEPFLPILSRLHAPYGVYSVLGNHDYGDYVDWPSQHEKEVNLALLRVWERQIGWDLLDNHRREIIKDGDTIQVIGVENWGEPPFRQYGHLTDAYPIARDSVYHLRDNRFKILLTHNPEHWRREVTKVSNVDLTLSGHTHAMQLMLHLWGNKNWSPAVWKYKDWGGLYHGEDEQSRDMQIYVNIGAGEVGLPFRIGAEPEVTVITLRGNE